MTSTAFSESTVESAVLGWLSELGWQVKHSSEIAPDGLFAERQDFGHGVLECWSSGCAMRFCPKLIRGEIRVKEAERFLKEMEERGL